MTTIESKLEQFLHSHQLPHFYLDIMHQHWLPLAQTLVDHQKKRTMLIGINGAQGSGKSTMTEALALLLRHQFDKQVVTLSIDDLYLTRQTRAQLAHDVHPLLQTRGVPGTHDIALGLALIQRLCRAKPHDATPIPRFDKANDDRLPEKDWPVHQGHVDYILFEGWCVGTPAQDEAQLTTPVNLLEAEEDQERIWRIHVNLALTGSYQVLFSALDLLIMLEAPDFETIYQWRKEQEEKLRKQRPDAPFLMNDAQLTRFISHYERLTRHNLHLLPDAADVLYRLDREHHIHNCRFRHEAVLCRR